MLPLLVAFALAAPKTITLVPTETVWVYANASTPADGTYLRAWGVEGKSCPPEGEDAGQFSFSYLKWDLADLPKGAKITSAKLTLTNIADPGFTVETSKRCPIEVRPVVGEFEAKKWTFDMSSKVRPNGDDKSIFGTGFPDKIASETPVPITVDLLKGPNKFAEALDKAQGGSSHTISLSITSKLDPSADGRSCIYKLYGQNESKEWLRPQLVLTFE